MSYWHKNKERLRQWHREHRINNPLKNVHGAMLSRCYNPQNKSYHLYGGRDIKVCNEWHPFPAFQKWALTNGWKKGLPIDRIDSNGDYTPKNCRFVIQSDNNRNSRRAKLDLSKAQEIRKLLANGKSVSAIAKAFGVSYSAIDHVKHGRSWT